MLSWNTIAKVAWIALLTSGVVTYGWFRLRPHPPYEFVVISADVFHRLNRGGQLMGEGADTVVVFTNYQCGACGLLFNNIESILATDSSALTVRLRHFAPPTIDSVSFLASVAAFCADAHDMLEVYNRWLYEQIPEYSALQMQQPDTIANLETSNSFAECMESDTAKSAVIDDLNAGIELQIVGTPTILTRQLMVTGVPEPQQLLKLASGT